jgi:hypothetical protein
MLANAPVICSVDPLRRASAKWTPAWYVVFSRFVRKVWQRTPFRRQWYLPRTGCTSRVRFNVRHDKHSASTRQRCCAASGWYSQSRPRARVVYNRPL